MAIYEILKCTVLSTSYIRKLSSSLKRQTPQIWIEGSFPPNRNNSNRILFRVMALCIIVWGSKRPIYRGAWRSPYYQHPRRPQTGRLTCTVPEQTPRTKESHGAYDAYCPVRSLQKRDPSRQSGGLSLQFDGREQIPI